MPCRPLMPATSQHRPGDQPISLYRNRPVSTQLSPDEQNTWHATNCHRMISKQVTLWSIQHQISNFMDDHWVWRLILRVLQNTKWDTNGQMATKLSSCHGGESKHGQRHKQVKKTQSKFKYTTPDLLSIEISKSCKRLHSNLSFKFLLQICNTIILW